MINAAEETGARCQLQKYTRSKVPAICASESFSFPAFLSSWYRLTTEQYPVNRSSLAGTAKKKHIYTIVRVRYI